jgi:hypothetical protein
MSKTSFRVVIALLAVSACQKEGLKQATGLDADYWPSRGTASPDAEDSVGDAATTFEVGGAGGDGVGGIAGGGGGSGSTGGTSIGTGGTSLQSTVPEAGPDSPLDKKDVVVAVGPEPGPDAPQAPEAGRDVSIPDLPRWLACYLRENIGCQSGEGCYFQAKIDPDIGFVLTVGCAPAGSGVLGSTCNSHGHLECAPGFICRQGPGTGGGAGCFPACSTSGKDCPSGMTCRALTQKEQEVSGELDLGVCQ